MAEWQGEDEKLRIRLRPRAMNLPSQRGTDPRDWLDLPWTPESRPAGGKHVRRDDDESDRAR